MGFPSRLLKDQITYWPPASENKYGAKVFGAPQLIAGRWEDNMALVRGSTGDQIKSIAKVFVPEDVQIGGRLYRGDATMDSDPIAAGALEILTVVTVPDQRSATSERRAYL